MRDHLESESIEPGRLHRDRAWVLAPLVLAPLLLASAVSCSPAFLAAAKQPSLGGDLSSATAEYAQTTTTGTGPATPTTIPEMTPVPLFSTFVVPTADANTFTPAPGPFISPEQAAEIHTRRKVSYDLRRLAAAQADGTLTDDQRRSFGVLPNDWAPVHVHAAPGRLSDAISAIRSAGGRVGAFSDESLDALVPLWRLAELEDSTAIIYVAPDPRLTR